MPVKIDGKQVDVLRYVEDLTYDCRRPVAVYFYDEDGGYLTKIGVVGVGNMADSHFMHIHTLLRAASYDGHTVVMLVAGHPVLCIEGPMMTATLVTADVDLNDALCREWVVRVAETFMHEYYYNNGSGDGSE